MTHKTLAPISVSTYDRLEHLRKTIEALQKNTLANESVLYIFSDAPKRGDEEAILKVRNYIHTISGFKELRIIEQSVNNIKKNIDDAREIPLNEFGKIIRMEDDIITETGFLTYMNQALDFYENNDQILNISGYCPPINIPSDYPFDAFILQRFSGWGHATWREKFKPLNFSWQENDIDTFLRDKKAIRKFKENGEDLYYLLLRDVSGEIDAVDVKMSYYEYKFNLYTLYPKKSLVQNIGHDGSGVHCSKNNLFYHDKLWDKQSDFYFAKVPELNKVIKKNSCKFHAKGYRFLISKFMKHIGIYDGAKFIRDEILRKWL